MTSSKRATASASKAASDKRNWSPSVVAALVLVAVGGAWLLFSRGPNFAAEAMTLQQQLLSEDVSPQQRRAMLTTVMRHVDKLDSAAQRKLMTDVRQQWREIQQQDMDAYFAAPPADRQAALDRSLDRLILIGDLTAAFSPGGMRVRQPRPQPRPQPPADRTATASQPPRPSAPDPATTAARRKAMEAYTAALERRARERGIEMPTLGRRQRG